MAPISKLKLLWSVALLIRTVIYACVEVGMIFHLSKKLRTNKRDAESNAVSEQPRRDSFLVLDKNPYSKGFPEHKKGAIIEASHNPMMICICSNSTNKATANLEAYICHN